MSNKERKHRKGIFGVRRSANKQLRPFGRYSDPFSSDDSEDSDYEPTAKRDNENEEMSSEQDSLASEIHSGNIQKRQKNFTGRKKPKTLSVDIESKISSYKSWSDLIPSEVLLHIFTYCVESQGAIPLLSRYVA